MSRAVALRANHHRDTRTDPDVPEETFERFLARNLRRAPWLAGLAVAFLALRLTGLRAGAYLVLALAFAVLPIAAIRPEVGLHVLVANSIAGFDAYYGLQAILPVSLPILFDVTVGFGILLYVVLGGRMPRMLLAQNFLVLLYVVLVTLSVFVSTVARPDWWAHFRTGFLIRPILYLYLLLLIRDPVGMYRLLLTFVAAHTILMVVSFSDFLQKDLDFYRVVGMWGQANLLSYVCITTFPILLVLFLYARDVVTRLFLGGLAFLTFVLSFQTLSRSGYFSLLATLLFLGVRFLRTPRTLAVALGLGALFYLLTPVALEQRLAEVESIEETDRYLLSRLGLRMALDNPVFGVGWHAYLEKFPEYDYESIFYRPTAPHSLYFAIAAQSGFPALLVYLTIYGITFAQLQGLQRRYRTEGHARTLGYHLAVGIEAALVGHFTFGLAGSYADTYYAYLLLAMAVMLVRYHRDQPEFVPLR